MLISAAFIDKVLQAFLTILISLMDSASITLKYSRTATRDFLHLFPSNSIEELHAKLKTYAEAHPEFKSIYIEFMKLRESNQTDDVLTKMRSLMKENNLDKAIQVA